MREADLCFLIVPIHCVDGLALVGAAVLIDTDSVYPRVRKRGRLREFACLANFRITLNYVGLGDIGSGGAYILELKFLVWLESPGMGQYSVT